MAKNREDWHGLQKKNLKNLGKTIQYAQQWRSFFKSGSTRLFIYFIYSIYFATSKLQSNTEQKVIIKLVIITV